LTSSTTSSSPESTRARRGRWRTVDLVTVVMVAVAFGVVFVGWGALTNVLAPLFLALPPLAGLVYGFFWVPAVVAALIVRRPGAALLAELVAASVEPLLGGQWGVSTLGSGVCQGLAVVGGILAGIFEAPYEWRLYFREWSAGYAGLYAVTLAVSGALLAGVLGWALVRGLARTGALAPFAAGRDRSSRL
jgi:energy-coupling factor transport system substrate-specific component